MTKKLAIIIGGSHGLGRALVAQYLAAGWQVREFSRSGTGVGHVDLDLSGHDFDRYTHEMERLCDQAWDEIVYINNAATILPIKPLQQISYLELNTALRVNFTAAIELMHRFVLLFAQHKARKVLAQISSGAAQKGYGSWSLYCASKAGVDHFIAAFAAEQLHSPTPILAICIDPDVIDTGMQATIRAADPTQFPDLPRFFARKANNLLRSPDHVAQFCLHVIAKAEQGCRYDIADEAET